jgi:hypothetical protein
VLGEAQFERAQREVQRLTAGHGRVQLAKRAGKSHKLKGLF